ncbi:MAG: hypothetical protein Q9160_003885 [Pyrenula sp. 1 TL-2023]
MPAITINPLTSHLPLLFTLSYLLSTSPFPPLASATPTPPTNLSKKSDHGIWTHRCACPWDTSSDEGCSILDHTNWKNWPASWPGLSENKAYCTYLQYNNGNGKIVNDTWITNANNPALPAQINAASIPPSSVGRTGGRSIGDNT